MGKGGSMRASFYIEVTCANCSLQQRMAFTQKFIERNFFITLNRTLRAAECEFLTGLVETDGIRIGLSLWTPLEA